MIDRRWANLILRVVIGLLFLFAGVTKVFYYARVPVEKILPFLGPEWGSILLGIAEMIIGLLLVVGLLTRYAAVGAAVLIVIFMVSALILSIFMEANQISNIPLLAATLMLVADGARKWSLDEKIF